jgi:cytochrome c553
MSERTVGRLGVSAALVTVGMATAAGVGYVAASQQVRSTPERLAQMQHHFAQVTLIHEAVIRGDLPAVRKPAKALAEAGAPQGVPASTTEYVSALRLAAGRARDATELSTAASAAASMLLSCGGCHRAAGTMPVPEAPQRPEVGGLVGHMLEHQRAVDEMLEGLFIPSDSQWWRGASRLRTAALRRESLPRDRKLTREIRSAEERVHDLAERATKTQGWQERAELYGQMLTTCASCHSLHGLVWGPRRSR